MNDQQGRNGWYRQPLFWLGSLILVASLAGCVWMILLASRYPDPALDTGSEQILRMPLSGSLTATATGVAGAATDSASPPAPAPAAPR